MSSQQWSFEICWRAVKFLRACTSNAFSIPFKQLPRVSFHGLILGLIIAAFWLLDSLKDPVLAGIVGIEYQPVAKLISVLNTLIVTCMYDWLTSKLKRNELFHFVSVVFGLCFMIISALLADPQIGLSNRDDRGPHRWLGFGTYILIEAYGSLMVALFWSFTNSMMNLEEAKGAYGFIIAVAQLGAVVGSTLATRAHDYGIPQLFLCAAMAIFSTSLLVKVYSIFFPKIAGMGVGLHVKRESAGVSGGGGGSGSGSLAAGGLAADDSSTASYSTTVVSESGSGWWGLLQGFGEGLRLVFRSRYMLLVFGVTCMDEIVITVMDYQFKILAVAANSERVSPVAASAGAGAGTGWGPNDAAGGGAGAVHEDQLANMLGHFGQTTNLVSFFVSFFGFSFLVNRFGVRNSLMVFPCVMFVAVVVSNLMPTLRVLFLCVSVLKALVFSLHDPVKELLYIPTSLPMKFKAKAWIDVFGVRLAKATGSAVSYASNGNAQTLRTLSEVPCLLISVGMMVVAYAVGNEFQRLVDRGERVE